MEDEEESSRETSDKMSENLKMEKEMYVAVGFGRDKRNLQGMDVSACYKEGGFSISCIVWFQSASGRYRILKINTSYYCFNL